MTIIIQSNRVWSLLWGVLWFILSTTFFGFIALVSWHVLMGGTPLSLVQHFLCQITCFLSAACLVLFGLRFLDDGITGREVHEPASLMTPFFLLLMLAVFLLGYRQLPII